MIALAIILGYAFMVWVMSLLMGMWSYDDKMDECDWLMAAFWPFTLFVLLLVDLAFFLNCLWSKVPRESILRKMCIVFKPFHIGTMIRKWLERKKDKKLLKGKNQEGGARE